MADPKSTVVACACGCGGLVQHYDKQGRVRWWLLGHHGSPRKPRQLRETLVGYRSAGRGKMLHVVIAETALGKPLPKRAEVHHVDGVKFNNAHSNLVICQDHAYHMLLHVRARVVRAGGNPNTQRICFRCRKLWPWKNTKGRLCPACSQVKWAAYSARKSKVPQ